MSAVLGLLLAQAAAGSPPGAPPRPPAAPRFFERPLDYWGRGLAYPGPSRASGADWTQTVRLPDGTLAVRELPPLLVRVLEDPSPANLRAYLESRLERTRKILLAAERMKALRGEPPALPPADPPLPAPPPPRALAAAPGGEAPGGPLLLTYFHREGCPPCRLQDRVLPAWLARHPGVRLQKVGLGEQPGLWRETGVRGTPTLLLEDPALGTRVRLEGYSGEAELEQALRQVRKERGR